MNYKDLPQDVKNATALIVDTDEKIKVHRLKIKELASSPQYLGAKKVLTEKASGLVKQLADSIASQKAMLKTLTPKRHSNGSKAEWTFKVVGQDVEIVNNNKTLRVPLNAVGYNTAFIGNAQGQVGKIAEIDLTFQQGKSLVKAIKG